MAPARPALIAVFLATGCLFIPLLGIQNDEALFATAVFPKQCGPPHASLSIAGRDLPLMLMSYVGALKAWIYRALFRVWQPSVWSLRLPMLLAATAAMLLWFRTLRVLWNPAAAFIALALLATDPIFLLASTFDWGPVALQHLLLAAATWHAVRFHQTGSTGSATCAGLAAGLAIWNKATAAWPLLGGVVLLAAAKPKLSWRATGAAVVGTVIGSLPLWVFNLTSDFQTFRDNLPREPVYLAAKAEFLGATLDGDPLFGYLVRPDAETPLPRRGLMKWATIGTALAGLAASATRRCAFVMIAALTAGWLFMVASGGGLSVHHTVQLWPLPHLIVALVAATFLARVRRWAQIAIAAAVFAVAIANAAVTLRYLQSAKFGAGRGWSNALPPLAQTLRQTTGRNVYLADWGIRNGLCVIEPTLAVKTVGQDATAAELDGALADPAAVFVRHVGGMTFFSEISKRLETRGLAQGLRLSRVAIVNDGFGNPIYELFRFSDGNILPASR